MHVGWVITYIGHPSQNSIEKKIDQKIVEFWINSTAAVKMKQPEYVNLNWTDLDIENYRVVNLKMDKFRGTKFIILAAEK